MVNLESLSSINSRKLVGTVVYGKVESGTVRIGDKLVIAPNGHLM